MLNQRFSFLLDMKMKAYSAKKLLATIFGL